MEEFTGYTSLSQFVSLYGGSGFCLGLMIMVVGYLASVFRKEVK